MTACLLSYAESEDDIVRRSIIKSIELAFGRTRIAGVYAEWRDHVVWNSAQPFSRLLEMYCIDLRFEDHWPIEDLPSSPIVMVANHPFGVADGMILGAIAEQIGRPYKVLVNARMMKVPEFRPFILPVCFDETEAAMKMNLETRNEAVKLLRQGHTIGIFPSGGVSTAPRGFGPVEELPWKMFLPKLVHMGKASVLPLFIHGQNSLLFQAASKFSLTLRTALLFREFQKQLDSPVSIRVGNAMPWQEIAAINDRKALLTEIKRRVMDMQPHDRRRDFSAAIRARENHWLWRESFVSKAVPQRQEAF